MKLLNRVYIHALLPGLERERHSGLAKRLREFEERERLSLQENRHLQLAALRALLRHAYNTTPFYRSRMQQARLTPDDLHLPDDLQRLPPLSRNDIRVHLT